MSTVGQTPSVNIDLTSGRAVVEAAQPQAAVPSLEKRLTDAVIAYKKNPEIYPELWTGNNENELLTEMDEAQIATACFSFEEQVEKMLGNRDQLAKFVKYCLRAPGLYYEGRRTGIVNDPDARVATHWVEMFFNSPTVMDSLYKCFFIKRAGACNPRLIARVRQQDGSNPICIRRANPVWIQTEHGWKRTEGPARWISMEGLDHEILEFPSLTSHSAAPYRVSRGQMRSDFIARTDSYTPLELNDEGIVNWNTIGFGSDNPNGTIDGLDETQPDWHRQIPVWRRLNEAQLRRRYWGQVDWIDNPRYQDGLAMCATRTDPGLNVSKTHGFVEYIVREPAVDGQERYWRVISFSVQPTSIPTSTLCGIPLGKLFSLCATVRAALFGGPDESVVLDNRAHKKQCYGLTPDESRETVKQMGILLRRGREGSLTFCPTALNCAGQMQQVFDKVIGREFRRPFRQLALQVFPQRDIRGEMSEITCGMNTQALDTLAKDLAKQLVADEDPERIGRLITLCCQTIGRMSRSDALAGVVEQQVHEQIALRLANGVPETLQEDLTNLIVMAFECQQFFKTSIYATSIDAPVIGGLFAWICSIETEWLRDLIYSVICFILLHWTGYRYTIQKRDRNGHVRTQVCVDRFWNTEQHKHRKLTLPAALWNYSAQLPVLRNRTIDIYNGLTAAAH